MRFETRIDGSLIQCVLTPDQSLFAPVLCYSCMAPNVSADGFERLCSVGGYSEIQLPDLAADEAFAFSLAYENPDFGAANRAWLPRGAYLRCGSEIIPLPRQEPAGVLPGIIEYGEGVKPPLLVCPQPTSFTGNGQTAKIAAVHTDAPDILRVDDLTQRSGLGSLVASDGAPLVVTYDASMPAESYRMEIAEHSISLFHSDANGAFYGGITLATLIANHDGLLPCGTITDTPRFEWRGQHLDCARHFYEVPTILRLLDLMALLKMNRFHWHFADDESFRLELQSLPELAQTHFRGENELLPGIFGGGVRAGGCYSRQDAEKVIEHAHSLGIEVMPEIEVPAHALALCKVYPETRDPLDTGTEQSVQGYLENAMNPAMPESWRVWDAMVEEVSEIFPAEYLHIGGDELAKNTWQGSPAAKDLMRTEGLSTTQDLQGWTMNKVAKSVAAKGKTPCGWEESALGTPSIGNDAIIFSWTGQGPGLQAARDGHRVVMMPGQHTYLDMAQTDLVNDWGANWASIIAIEDTIRWDPLPDNEPELEENIVGLEGAFWSEFTCEDLEMEAMLAPRILGIAMLGWQAKDSAEANTLLGLRSAYAGIFDKMGWRSS